MSVGRIASRYAKSLLELGVEQNQLEEVVSDVKQFIQSVDGSKELRNLLRSPIIKSDKKVGVYKAIFGGKFNSLADRFFELVIKKGRESVLPEICTEFLHQYKEHKGVSGVKITSAIALSEEEKGKIKERLLSSDQTYAKVELEYEVDASLIGGFKIELGDKLYDDSVAHKIELLRKEFSNN